MWAFFSRRLRTWLLFAIAVPVVRALVHKFASRAQRTRPTARSTSLLTKADSTVTSLSQRRSRRRGRAR
jgi:hypothetical protein